MNAPVDPRFELRFEALPRVNHAMLANGVALVTRCTLRNLGAVPAEDLRLRFWIEPDLAPPVEIRLDALAPGALHALRELAIDFDDGRLVNLSESLRGRIHATLRSGDGPLLAHAAQPIDVLAYNQWPGSSVRPESLVAFVLPNHPALAPLLKRARNLLETATGDPSFSGHQRRDPERIRLQAAALYDALVETGTSYVNPPASFEDRGQKLRTVEQILDGGMGTCLDLAVLWASMVEAVGLRPLLLVGGGHALAALWLEEESFPEGVIFDDPVRVRKRLRLDRMLAVDPTTASARPPASFAGSVETARRFLDELDGELLVLDVVALRAMGLRPVPPRLHEAALHQVLREEDGPRLVAPGGPVLPPPPPVVEAPPPPAAESPGPRERLDRWKDRLLDLSLRNRLLNFREGRNTVPLRSQDLGALEDALAEGHRFTLIPLGDGEDDGGRDREQALEAFRKGRLPAALGEAELGRRLTQIYRTARRSLEENGTNTLYLAMGMLSWCEGLDGSGRRKAPVLLLPVELERRSMREGFRLSLGDDDPRINLTLLKRIEVDHGIRIPGLDPLPQDDAGLDVAAILRAVREALLPLERWEILDEAWLGLFSFTKFLMWNDLDTRAEDLKANPLVRHLVETPSEAFPDQGPFPRAEELDGRPPEDRACPLPADGSQLAAIAAAGEGKTFVLEGPPGTGKSQTIANMIVNALGRGRTVLFISEKMAALDVVYRRIETLGLGAFCLELHSNRARKLHVLDQLGEVLDLERPSAPERWDGLAEELGRLRDRLNGYVAALHGRRALGMSLHEALARLVELEALPRIPLPDAPAPASLDGEGFERLRRRLEDLLAAGRALGDAVAHPLARLRREDWDPALPRKMEELLREADEARRRLEDGCAALGDGWPVPLAELSRRELEAQRRLAELALSAPAGLPPELLDAEDWPELRQGLERWCEVGRRANALREELEKRWDTEALLALSLDALREDFRWWCESLAPLRWFMLRKARHELEAVARGRLEGRESAVLEDLDRAVRLRALRRRIADFAGEAKTLPPGLFRGEETDWSALDAMADWTGACRDALREAGGEELARREALGRFLHGWLDGTARGDEATLAAFVRRAKDFAAARAALEDFLDLPPDEDGLDRAAHLARHGETLRLWGDHVEDLADLCAWARARRRAREAGLGPLVERWLSGEVEAEGLCELLERSVLEGWVEDCLRREPTLASFRGGEHDRAVEAFRRADAELARLAARLVGARLAMRLPRGGDTAAASEMGILLRERKKRRRHRSVRWLLERIPTLLPRLCPCLLMSPLSVAQYLDPSHPPFDLVIFDEASQIPVWDAVGAIARGRSAVVVGDSKQLPPTSFFQKGEDEELPTEDEIEELESILDECVAAGLPSRPLLWHYRSRHESLIAFSNRHYYDDRLLSFPSPRRRGDGLGIRLHPVPEGRYDRGGSHTNEAEARALVAELRRRLTAEDGTAASIGVVTFSVAQQALVEDLIDEARRDDPLLDERFGAFGAEPPFVKNLETVQGDERDTILFSVCYGPDERGRVAMNFGPLNRQGGERRLNVAITRARRELVVFSTLTADMIDLNRSAARGAADLKLFLDYAARGPAASGHGATRGDGGGGDGFTRSVAAFLERAGWPCEIRRGRSRLRVDLAVLDPDDPERFLLAVLLDGADYAAAGSARDRDRIPPEVLAGLGWRCHRIWAPEWWSRPRREGERLLRALEEARKAAPRSEEAASQPEERPSPSTDEGQPSTDEGKPSTDEGQLSTDEGKPSTDEAHPDPLSERRSYRTWEPSFAPRPSESFHDAESTVPLVKALAEVVAVEGPVCPGLATRRVALAWGIRRCTEKVRRRVEEALALFHVDERPVEREGWLWPRDVDPESWRIFRVPEDEAGAVRNAEEVPPREAANAAAWILARAVAMPREELLKETGKLLGFRRLGDRVRAMADAGVDRLVAEGRALVQDDRIVHP